MSIDTSVATYEVAQGEMAERAALDDIEHSASQALEGKDGMSGISHANATAARAASIPKDSASAPSLSSAPGAQSASQNPTAPEVVRPPNPELLLQIGTRGARHDASGMVRELTKLTPLGFRRRTRRLNASDQIKQNHRNRGARTILESQTGIAQSPNSTIGAETLVSPEDANFVATQCPWCKPMVKYLQEVDE